MEYIMKRARLQRDWLSSPNPMSLTSYALNNESISAWWRCCKNNYWAVYLGSILPWLLWSVFCWSVYPSVLTENKITQWMIKVNRYRPYTCIQLLFISGFLTDWYLSICWLLLNKTFMITAQANIEVWGVCNSCNKWFFLSGTTK